MVPRPDSPSSAPTSDEASEPVSPRRKGLDAQGAKRNVDGRTGAGDALGTQRPGVGVGGGGGLCGRGPEGLVIGRWTLWRWTRDLGAAAGSRGPGAGDGR